VIPTPEQDLLWVVNAVASDWVVDPGSFSGTEGYAVHLIPQYFFCSVLGLLHITTKSSPMAINLEFVPPPPCGGGGGGGGVLINKILLHHWTLVTGQGHMQLAMVICLYYAGIGHDWKW